MGFILNKKRLCSICGAAIPLMRAKKFGGKPICTKCVENIMLKNIENKGLPLEDIKVNLGLFIDSKKDSDKITSTYTEENKQ